MPKEKRKNSSFTRLYEPILILLWSIPYAAGFGVLWLTLQYVEADIYKASLISKIFLDWDFSSKFIFFGLLIPALIQMLLVKRILQMSRQVWISLTGVGIILSWAFLRMVQGFVPATRPDLDLKFGLFMVALFTPVAMIQTIGLAERMKRPWVWPLASLIGSICFLAKFQSVSGLGGFLEGGCLYGVLTGAVLVFQSHALQHEQAFQSDF